MPKPFVVLWDHPWSSFATCLPRANLRSCANLPLLLQGRGSRSRAFPRITDAPRTFPKTTLSISYQPKNTPTAHDMTKNLGIHHFFGGIYGSSPETPHKGGCHPLRLTNTSTPLQTKSSSLGIPSLTWSGPKKLALKVRCYLGIWRKRLFAQLSTWLDCPYHWWYH